ncbi:MAG: DUF3556 domain-containing protein [Sandaracinaceae bacterium]|nr:DUF3556 domain-containing protein [Sandaracinaceae bacterium]
MKLMKPELPPYDPFEWERLPFRERAKLVCESWCMDGYGSPFVVYVAYLLKIAGYIALWFFFCGFTPGLGSTADLARWWADPVAFQKAILLTTMMEGLGMAGSSGPLTGRYLPPFGGFLYFLRPGTTKLALFPALPLLGGTRRTLFDVALYAGFLGLALTGLCSASIPGEVWLGLVVVVPLMGIADKTLFPAARSEHYWPTMLCFAFMPNWVAGAKAVQLAIWFWAGVSKCNAHFPTVVGVMTSNHPVVQAKWIRRRMYKDFPNDVRPAAPTIVLTHIGTLIELVMPMILAFAVGGWPLTLGLTLMVGLHLFIFSNMPMAVPLEWNVMAVYGAFALFYVHPDVSVFHMDSLPVAAVLFTTLVLVPLFGNLFPERFSFLVSMRYYAGNWPYTIWLFKGDSRKKMMQLTMSAPWVHDQLNKLYEPAVTHAILGKVLGFRLMHLQGRALSELLPKTVPNLADYEYYDGEIIAGLVLGWNFGDGHLHNERLLRIVQDTCGFEPGELRCLCVEAQPLGRPTMAYRIYDAATGLLEAGKVDVRAMQARQPWDAPADVAASAEATASGAA